ncbi:Uncharacterized protein BP5553_03534 [Venustampulla echinocandica]|uniref:25S rRNA (Uridine(2843)-N(3))-methyltransferase n=1 Tax=Venustampulla echinocandica TaxID=2656787 RepID=A0A370TUJ6_9HELO|nr:Uncharacterized protein BP5553_03534 [Venustampulla echinocandica]RDL39194.1 Uncharacterized protein BP5553_03534 [Venustampulla echinocandica]
MGKNGRFGKDYGRVVGKDNDSRPGWKGPAFVKKAEPSKSKAKSSKTSEGKDSSKDLPSEPEILIPLELQQLLLNIFRDSFSTVLTSDTLLPLLQDVKAALFDRDFTRAFGNSEYLEAYAARWSPSRALCYQTILVDVQKHISEIIRGRSDIEPSGDHQQSVNGDVPRSQLDAVSFGGSAAEVIAFGGFLRYLQNGSTPPKADGITNGDLKDQSSPDNSLNVNLLLLDCAGWEDVVRKLHNGLVTPPPLSKYASASAKAANSSLITDEHITSNFRLDDMLSLTRDQLDGLVGARPMLLTLLFTLNELYTASISKTTAFLLNLTMTTKPGSLLLVVDSPGSYSETRIGTEEKKYPMKWLLDHVLLESQRIMEPRDGKRQEAPPDWVKVVSEDSKWFRMPEGFRYPIPLENMRYQIHLYRRV